MELSVEQGQALLALARRTIADKLGVTGPEVPGLEAPVFGERRGAFVTLHAHGMLRGCIGHIEPVLPLTGCIREMAIAAAFSDPRFPRLRAEEYAEVELEISVLSPLFPVTAEKAIIGTHGLVISRDGRRGVFLPQVAPEQGWDRETWLTELSHKAGLPGDAWRKGAELMAFTAQIFGENEQ